MSCSNNLYKFKYFKLVISSGVFKTGDSHIGRLVGIVLEILLKLQVLIPLVMLFMQVVLDYKNSLLVLGK